MKNSIDLSLGHLMDLHAMTAMEKGWWRGLLPTFCIVIITSLAAWLLVFFGFPSPESLSVLFVIPVLFSAIFYGLAASLIAAFISVLAYNFVLLTPLWHIGLLEAENFTKMAVLSLVASVASALSARIRNLAREALQRERVLSGVYALSQDMLGIANTNEMRLAAETKLSQLVGSEVRILPVAEKEWMEPAARQCLEQNLPTGRGSRIFPESEFLYLPLSSQYGALGVMKLKTDAYSPKILATLAAQTASALEKARLAEAHEQKRREAEREKFLSALLSSVSHDFKTPLVTVMGVFSALQEDKTIAAQVHHREMIASGLAEAHKLNRYITNLMEISRLESQLEGLRKEMVGLRDLLANALQSLYPMIGERHFSITMHRDFPLLKVNAALMELVFLNLLENAVKYGPASGEIKIIAEYNAGVATIDIDDDGPGIPVAEREAVFTKFYRSQQGDRRIAGTGLGLYICRGIVEAHGGTVLVIDPHDGKGACLRVMLPSAALLPVAIEEEIEEVPTL